MLRKIGFVIAFFLLSLCLVGVVVAGGPYARWLSSGAVVYTDPDTASDAIVTVAETVPVSVTITTGWAEIVTPPELVGFVQTSQLLREEPQVFKDAREQAAQAAAQAAMEKMKVGDLTWGELKVLLRQLGQPAPTSAAPIAPVASATYVVQPGDWMAKIAKEHGVSLQDLMAANGLTMSSTIHPDQVLVIPAGAAPVMSAVLSAQTGNPTPLHAVKLTPGQSLIPPWGYGPWGTPGIRYPKVQPNGVVPSGASQLVTDFDGRNWRDNGSWSYTLPAGATQVWVTIQGDAPAQVSWSGNTLTLATSASITVKAPKALDNAPMPLAGSSGISAVVYVK